MQYYAFGLLGRDGDLRKLPQIERKQALSDLLGENDIGLPVIYSEHLTGDGQEVFRHASKLNWEGIISKRADAPYKSERNENWVKIKTVIKGKFPVIGFIKTQRASLRSISGSAKATNWSTWARSGPVGPGRCQENQEAVRLRGPAEVQVDQADQEAEGHIGRAFIHGVDRVSRHHIGRPSSPKLLQGTDQK